MKFIATQLPEVYIIEPQVFVDERGGLIKTLHKDTFLKEKLNTTFDESFYSFSKKNVIRGMHFQVPPKDHAKIVYVPKGAILDVILDLRQTSPTYGHHISVELSEHNRKSIYIPHGCAHGFLSLEDDSYTVYLQETVRSAEHEAGIRYDSFGMNWGIASPIVSTRDKTFPSLANYHSPFIFNNKPNS